MARAGLSAIFSPEVSLVTCFRLVDFHILIIGGLTPVALLQHVSCASCVVSPEFCLPCLKIKTKEFHSGFFKTCKGVYYPVLLGLECSLCLVIRDSLMATLLANPLCEYKKSPSMSKENKNVYLEII